MIGEILNFATEGQEKALNYPEQIAKLISTMSRLFTHVIIASALAVDMDREKFAVYVDGLTTIMKKRANEEFNKSKEREEDKNGRE